MRLAIPSAAKALFVLTAAGLLLSGCHYHHRAYGGGHYYSASPGYGHHYYGKDRKHRHGHHGHRRGHRGYR